jgi:hypothetical protein
MTKGTADISTPILIKVMDRGKAVKKYFRVNWREIEEQEDLD